MCTPTPTSTNTSGNPQPSSPASQSTADLAAAQPQQTHSNNPTRRHPKSSIHATLRMGSFTITELMFGCALLLTVSNIATLVISNHRDAGHKNASSMNASTVIPSLSLRQQLKRDNNEEDDPLHERAPLLRTPAGAGEPTLRQTLRGSYDPESDTADSWSALGARSPLLQWFYTTDPMALKRQKQQRDLVQLKETIEGAHEDLTRAMGLTGFSDQETEAVGVDYTDQDRAAWADLEQKLQSEHKSPNEAEEGDDDDDEAYGGGREEENEEGATNFDADMEQDVEPNPVLPKGFDVEFGRD